MERHLGSSRRRVIAVAIAACVIGALLLTVGNTAGASSPGRRWLDVQKLCPAKGQTQAPTFVFHNNTDVIAPAQTITFTLSDRYFLPKNGLTMGPFSIAPGETITWTAPATWPVKSPIATDYKYYALFQITIAGVTSSQRSDEYCVCSSVTTTTPTTFEP